MTFTAAATAGCRCFPGADDDDDDDDDNGIDGWDVEYCQCKSTLLLILLIYYSHRVHAVTCLSADVAVLYLHHRLISIIVVIMKALYDS